MTDLAPHLAAFLHDYLPQERSVSRHTIAATPTASSCSSCSSPDNAAFAPVR